MDKDDRSTLARVDQRSSTTERDLRDLEASTNSRFEQVFRYLDKRFDSMETSFNTLEHSVGDLMTEKNKRDGVQENKSKLTGAGGFSLNALIAAITAWATFKLIK